MSGRNRQMFALDSTPVARLDIGGQKYRLVRIFKHDFFAATCLYESLGECEFRRIVVKFYRTQCFFGLGMEWFGRFMRDHEQRIYAELAGLAGVPRWVAAVGRTGMAIEYIRAKPLDYFPLDMPSEFFDRLMELLAGIHARGIAYCDANKRSNILVTDDGLPFLVDYQIAISLRDDLPWPLRAIVALVVRYMQKCDIYHFYKHRRRLCKKTLTPEQLRLSLRRGRLLRMHRKLTDPWRIFRRWFLHRQYSRGQLESPTKTLEDYYQPEKATWRNR